MPSSFPIPDPITPEWLTTVLYKAGRLSSGEVLAATSQTTGAFNSNTQHLRLRYGDDALPPLSTDVVLKLNIEESWAVEAGIEEVKFYTLAASLQPSPPALVPCYAADHDSASGKSYLLLEDLSETHAPPITRDQQLSIVEGIPSATNIERVIETLAHHHAYWWNHSLLADGQFVVGYWSRNAERFAQYYQRRQTAWASLRTDEADWFPTDLRELYDELFAHLRHHWEHYLEPRFRTHTHLTLIHGDAYFTNFLSPRQASGGATYLLDWQSPIVDIAGYDLANLCATFWTSAQRHEEEREQNILERYYAALLRHGVTNYSWDDLITDYQTGIIYWLLVPLQDRYDGSPKAYWWPKLQCLVAAFREWRCAELLGMNDKGAQS